MLALAAATLLVLDLVPSGPDASVAKAATEEVVAAAIATNTAEVTSLESVRDVLGVEAKKQLLGGCDDSACAANVGASLEAKKVLAGSVLELGGRTMVQLRLIDAQTARVLGRETAQGAGSDELAEAVRRATFQLLGATYVEQVRHRAERPTEAGLRLALHAGGGLGSSGALGFAWRRQRWFVGPELAFTRAKTTVSERDLPGFEPIVREVSPTAVTGAVRGGWRHPIHPHVSAYAALALGLAIFAEPKLGERWTAGLVVHPAIGIEAPADRDLTFQLELGVPLYAGGADAVLHHLEPLGGTEVETKRLKLSGFEAAAGAKYAF